MKAMKLIYLLLLVTFVTPIETAEKPCSTVEHLPVVNICTDETEFQNDNDSILIQADIIQNCTCELSVINQDKAITVNIQRFGQETSSSPSDYGCGLILKFETKYGYFWDAQCIVDNRTSTKSISTNDTITISSLTVNGTLKTNEGYCIEIKKAFYDGPGNKLKIKCGIGSTTIINTTQSSEKTTKMTQTTVSTTTTKTTTMPITTTTVPTTTTTTVPTTTKTKTTIPTTAKTTTLPNTTTIANFTSTDGSVTTNQAIQLNIKDNDDTITLAVGASVGGFVIIIVVIVMVCINRRIHQKSTSQPVPAVNNDNDDYGLRDNVLYVSSQPPDTTQTQNNADSPTTNRISVDIDGNYSTVDLVVIPSVEESTGDYRSIDLVKLTPTDSNMNGSTNEKPIIAPKPKEKMTIQYDDYSVPYKKKMKYVTAPDENGCEYGVVSKPNKSNLDKSEDQPSTSNVYAVVEKTKRMSDGKGTNRK